jgi:hypothetical protein
MRDASQQFSILETKHKTAVDECAGAIAFFAEDAKVECEEFFGVFDQLLAKVDEVRRENETMRRKEEEDRKKQERLVDEQARKVLRSDLLVFLFFFFGRPTRFCRRRRRLRKRFVKMAPQTVMDTSSTILFQRCVRAMSCCRFHFCFHEWFACFSL